jgi:double zinc ribbon protein
MQCPRSHTENRRGRRFCGECGLSLSLACPACSFLNEGVEKFCGGYGAAAATFLCDPQNKFPFPESYTPKHLAEKMR